MKPHPRIRKTIKWGGAVVTVLLVGVWIGSGWWQEAWFDSRGNMLSISQGGATVAVTRAAHPVRPYLIPSRGFPTAVQPSWKTYGVYEAFSIPIWMLALAACCVSGWAWRLDTLATRRARLNLCPKCNYDRTGLARDAKCPECGVGGAASGSV